MKITIDLEEFWSDSESSNLNEQIKENIINQCKYHVWDQIKAMATDVINLKALEWIEEFEMLLTK